MKAGDDTLGGGMKYKEAPEDSSASQSEGTSGLDVNRSAFGIWNMKKDLRKGTLKRMSKSPISHWLWELSLECV